MKLVLGIFLFVFVQVSVFSAEISNSEIKFFVDHPTADVIGICLDVQSEKFSIQKVKDKFQLKSPFQIAIPIQKIQSGDSGRDRHIHEILGDPEFKDITARILSVTLEGEVYKIKGTLKVRNLQREFVSIAKVTPKTNSSFVIQGDFFVSFSEFELENPSLVFLKAKDQIKIDYKFEINH
ncbi:YceI family protein [Leptospira sp. 96542]|nr:YceI family protein [Leptospira sp. 96542]